MRLRVLAASLLLAGTGCSDDGASRDGSDELPAAESAANLARLESARDESIAIARRVARLLARAVPGRVRLTGGWEGCSMGEEEKPPPPTYTYRVTGWLDSTGRSPWMPSVARTFRAAGWTTSERQDGPSVRYLYADKAEARTQVSELGSNGGGRRRAHVSVSSVRAGEACLRLSGDEEEQVLSWAEDPPEVVAKE